MGRFSFPLTSASHKARSAGTTPPRAATDDDELRTEFLATRLVETGPGTVKLQNVPGQHDDIPTAVGMVVAALNEKPDTGPGHLTVPHASRPVERTLSRTEHLPSRSELQRLAGRGPRGVNFLPPTGR